MPARIAGARYRLVFEDRWRVFDAGWVGQPRVVDPDRPRRRSQYVRRGLATVRRLPERHRRLSLRKIFSYRDFEAWMKGRRETDPSRAHVERLGETGRRPLPGPVRAAEIDVFEGYGHHPRVFTGTIHHDSAVRVCPSPPGGDSSKNWQPRRLDLTKRLHTSAMRCMAARLTWFLDQRTVLS
jgi:hypothetical protein